MDFEAQKQRMAETAFRKFGVDAFYKSRLNPVPKKVRVILKRNFEKNTGALLTGISEKVTAVDFLYRQVPDPRDGDTVTINGEKFKVSEELDNNHIKVKVQVR
ncbi:MAG: hypothetical protein KZQ83_14935 [gamma proteobacterium symbiont of Taylorina sp.]|nr:hypothetical protein [gamma proteobacterium symbiont of Taylorina sp.]